MTGNQNKKSVIVVSDTHLGLTGGKRLYFFKNTVTHRPELLQNFLEWLRKLEEKGEVNINIGIAPDKVDQRKLVAPCKLILNGDILELWDASERASELSTRSIFNALQTLESEKFYLIGNHDFAMKEVEGLYPFGKSPVKIISDVYPEPEANTKSKPSKMAPLKIGENHYLFLHGHQFSWIFRNTPWQIMSYLRDGAESFGLFAWVFVLAWLFALSLTVLTNIGLVTLPSWMSNAAIGSAVVLGFIALPRVIVSIVRPIWNKFKTHRYRRTRAFNGFHGWWRKNLKNIQHIDKIHIVYGHTHTRGDFSKKHVETKLGKTIKGPDFVLINHPSWVNDHKYDNWVKGDKGQDEKINEPIFIYIDADGYEFFRWDEESPPPVHIPKELIPPHYLEKDLDDRTKAWLENIWTKKMLEQWKKPPSLARARGLAEARLVNST